MADTYHLAHKQSNSGQQQDLSTNVIMNGSNVINLPRYSQTKSGSQRQDGVRRCYVCGSSDHLISSCAEKSNNSKNISILGYSNIEESPLSQASALLLSHEQTKVGKYKLKSKNVRVPLQANLKARDIKELDNGLKLVKGYVNGTEAWVLRDTGCTTVYIVYISKTFAEGLGIKNTTAQSLRVANG